MTAVRDRAHALAVKLISLHADPDAAVKYIAGVDPSVLAGSPFQPALVNVHALARRLTTVEKYHPDQPRIPKGQPGGGRWMSVNTDGIAESRKPKSSQGRRKLKAVAEDIAAGKLDQAKEKLARETAQLRTIAEKPKSWWDGLEEETRDEVKMLAVQAGVLVAIVAYIALGGPLPSIPYEPGFNYFRDFFRWVFGKRAIVKVQA